MSSAVTGSERSSRRTAVRAVDKSYAQMRRRAAGAPEPEAEASSSSAASSVRTIGARRTSTAPTSRRSTSSGGGKVVCDRCDGPHASEECPIFRKARDSHPDAQRGKPKALSGGDNFVLGKSAATIIPQPGDGSCLFHSLVHSIGGNPATLRKEIAGFIRANPKHRIADTSLEDWIRYDAATSVVSYASRISRTGWGGGIEMAACSSLKGVNIHVYEACSRGYKRIARFDNGGRGKVVGVLYRGGVHFDALRIR